MATAASYSVADDFRQFILSVCGSAPDHVIADGKWHSFKMLDTRSKGSRPGRYLLHNDERPVGWVMDWRDEKVRHRWFGKGSIETIDRAEIERRRDARNLDRTRGFQMAADEALSFWRECKPLSELHPYLQRKGVLPHGTRQGSGARFGLGDAPCVIIPIADAEDRPMSLQAIREDGERRFWPGSTHEGGHFLIGKDSGDGPLVFCEGYSTGAAIHAATGLPVVMAVNTSNMAHVARWAVQRWAGREMIVAGDDDWHLVDHPKVKRNVGREEAEKMARALGARLVMPDMAGLVTDGGDDFNDMVREFGMADVAALFALPFPALPIDAPLPLVWAKDIKPVLGGNWIVKRVIPADGFVSVIGEPGCGKSFFILDLACHVAAGLEWRGRKVKQGLVVYLAAEGQRGQMNRVEAWKRENGIDDMPLALIPVAINLRDTATDLPKLVQTIEAAVNASGLPLSILIIDTLNRSFGGGDENGEDMGQYVGNADKLRQHFQCTTAHVHHIPKSGDLTERGHGSLRGAIDTSLGIVKDSATGNRTVICLKQKDGEEGWKLGFTLKSVVLGQDEDGEDVTTCVTQVDEDVSGATSKTRGPNLSATQRLAYNELLATIEAAGVAVPRDIPEDQIDRHRVGKVAARSVWRERWLAIQGSDMATDTASATFRRSVTDLINKGLVGAWNDHVWAAHK